MMPTQHLQQCQLDTCKIHTLPAAFERPRATERDSCRMSCAVTVRVGLLSPELGILFGAVECLYSCSLFLSVGRLRNDHHNHPHSN